MNRGYAGYYKGAYLRSSYEYAYARYLDHMGIEWRHEEQEFDLGICKYIPDFFIYEEGKLSYVVEIKNTNEKEKEAAKMKLDLLKEMCGIDGRLISYEELKQLYKKLPFSLTSIIDSWIKSENTTINKRLVGELNPHYGLKLSSKSRLKIGHKTKERWKDEKIRQRMIEGAKKGGMIVSQKLKGKIKVPRVERICEFCQMKFVVMASSRQRFCSQLCANKFNFKVATEAYVEKRTKIAQGIKELIIQWTKENKDIVLSTPANKIKTNLSPLLELIQERFGVKDFRVITKAVFGEEKGRKELLKFMKRLVA